MSSRRTGACLIAGSLALIPVLAVQPAQALTSSLTIQKVRTGPASITAGTAETTSFDITVTNTGILPRLAVFVDRMDTGLVIDSIETHTPSLNCAKRSGSDTEFLCYKLVLWGGDSATATVTAHAPAATRAGTYTNCAGLGVSHESPWPSAVCDPVLDSGLPEVTASVGVKNDADLAVTATTSPSMIDPGVNTTVAVGVTNNGPSDASGPVKVTTPLPSGLTFISGTAPWDCAATGQDVDCTWNVTPTTEGQAPPPIPVALFPVGATAPPLTLTVGTAKPATVGSYPVTVTVSAATPDSKPADNSATATILVTPVDLAISKAGAGTFQLNSSATWNLTVSNVGTIADAATVTVTDTLAAGLKYVSASGTGWTCGATGQTVICTKPGLALSASEVIAVTAKVGSAQASFANTAVVATGSYEQTTSNNSTSANATVTAVDLAIAKTALSASVPVNGQASWKLTVSNAGEIADLGAIVVTDTIPTGQTLVSAVGDAFTCTGDGRPVTCTYTGASMAPNASAEIVVTATVSGGGPRATNNASVATTSYETKLTNNTASADMAIRRVAQTATPLPKSPTKVKSGRTDQGQKIHTKVMCLPLKQTVAGEVSYCKVTRKGQYVKVKVKGTNPMRVKIIQWAKGTGKYKPFRQTKTYIVRP